MAKDLAARISRAKELIETVHHGVIATVNADGTPHNSPVFIAFDDQLQAFWASNQDALHSQNIGRTGQVFLVLFDTGGSGGGLYIQAAAQELEQSGFTHGLATFNTARQQLLREQVPASYFTGSDSQRLYSAVPERLWVNMSQKDAAGHIRSDRRYEVVLSDLI